MMRSLWTAASGMITQQTNVDTISNNLANINTTGYKRENAEFKTLLYQTIQKVSKDNQGKEKPVGIQVGLGVRNSAIGTDYTQGPLLESNNQFDLAISGNGFFHVQTSDGTIEYTRSGSFQAAVVDGGITLSDSSGNRLLDVNNKPIVIPDKYNIAKLTVDERGNICVPNEKKIPTSIGIQIGLAQFNNPAGLEKTANSMLKETEASGQAMIEGKGINDKFSTIKQGYLEGSNVQSVDEMVNLIVAQRAYEMNSKAIQASDTMLQQANNLRN